MVNSIADTREALANLGDSAGKAGGALKVLGCAGAGLTVLHAACEAMDALVHDFGFQFVEQAETGARTWGLRFPLAQVEE